MEKEKLNDDCSCGGNKAETIIANGWFPDGSIVNYVPNNDTITITPPAGWLYIGYDTNGNYVVADAVTPITISCTCKTGDGQCSPFSAGSQHGCATKTCTNCNNVNSIMVGGVPTTLMSGGFLNLSIVPAIMTNSQSLPAFFPAMTSSQEVQTIIQNFVESIYGQNPAPSPDTSDYYYSQAPDGYSYVFVNICGRATPFILPQGSFDDTAASGSAASCNPCQGTCKKGSTGPVVYCTANCTDTCSLVLGAIDDYSNVGGAYYMAKSFLY